MQNPTFRAYLENKINTASPEQLQLMLYEGGIRFAKMARIALEENDLSRASEAFERVDAILVELQCGLRPELDPELCDKFSQLYTFCARKLIEANLRHAVAPIDHALRILEHLRETWVIVLDQLSRDRALAATTAEIGEAVAV